VTSEETAYPAVWGTDTAVVQQIYQRPNSYLMALAKAKKGRNLRDADLLWSRSGRLLLAERLWLITTRVVAIRTSKKVLSNTWWPVATYADGISEGVLDKVLALWFNSTLGLLTIMAARVDTRGAWVDLKKPVLEELLVLDPRKLSESSLNDLCAVYDEIGKTELQPLPGIADDVVRKAIDDSFVKALGLESDLDTLRTLLGAEPVISFTLPGS
jgi:hypothetical protein